MNELNVKLLKEHMGENVDVVESHIDAAITELGVCCDKLQSFDEKYTELSKRTVALIVDSKEQIVTYIK